MGRSQNLETIVPVFVANVNQESGERAGSTVNRWLAPFVERFGERSIASLGAPDFLIYRAELSKKFSPSTAAAYLSAAKRLTVWAAAMDFRPPISLSAVRPPRQDPLPNKAWRQEEVRALLEMAERYNRQNFLWLAVQYLGTLRPSEMVRLAHRQGQFIEEGVFVPDVSKTARKSGVPRHLILCPTAMRLLEEVEPRWSCIQSYWDAASTATDEGPHRYRHSSASHLVQNGASILDAQMMLGHYSGSTFRYLRPNWQTLRSMAESLLVRNVPIQLLLPEKTQRLLPAAKHSAAA